MYECVQFNLTIQNYFSKVGNFGESLRRKYNVSSCRKLVSEL